MKALKIIVLALSILLPSSAFSGEAGKLRISLIEGEAYLYTEESGEWAEAPANMPLEQGDSLWVAEGGRAELHLRGSGHLRLDEGTMLDILAVGGDSAEFSLTEGRLYVNAEDNRLAPITVKTPASSARIGDAIAMIDVSGAGESRMSVLKGEVEVESGGWARRLYAGESLRVGDDLYASAPSRVPAPDEWERWNRRRDDDLYGTYASARHLPAELHAYAHDFDRGGRWVHVGAYGYVWTPTVSVSIGWAPYKHGRWAWVRGSYVWVSYEPWGWAPYHYGRWAYVARVGWCWVPPRRGEVHWGPGFVAWVYKPTYVAWVPLAPGEIYYGYGYYGPSSVNILNINISRTVINVRYKNVHVENAVTVVHRDAFVRGRKVDFKLRDNPFMTERAQVGPPREGPERHRGGVRAGRGRDGGRPSFDAGGRRTTERMRPGKPARADDFLARLEAPAREIPRKGKAAPPGRRSADRPEAIGKERGPLGSIGHSERPLLSREKGTPDRPEARAVRPRVDRPSPSIAERKPPRAEAKAAPKPKAPPEEYRQPGKPDVRDGKAKGDAGNAPRVWGAPRADGKGPDVGPSRVPGRGARKGRTK